MIASFVLVCFLASAGVASATFSMAQVFVFFLFLRIFVSFVVMMQANISLYLSAAAYCDKSTYPTRTFIGPTTGFKYTMTIYDQMTDTQGFVRYLPSDKSIYVSYRGSSSIKNWISNLDAFKTAYTSFPECACEVHKGFYEAEQKV